MLKITSSIYFINKLQLKKSQDHKIDNINDKIFVNYNQLDINDNV